MSGIKRTGDECYWCEGDLAEGGSIRIQLNDGEPKRETCPDCLRDWPPDHPDLSGTDIDPSEEVSD
jgi:hypothetical protein